MGSIGSTLAVTAERRVDRGRSTRDAVFSKSRRESGRRNDVFDERLPARDRIVPLALLASGAIRHDAYATKTGLLAVRRT